MVIPFSFTFKSPALDKYVSVSSLSKSSKFLILQFLVKCCKLHSVFKILSKSHMLDIFLISSVYYKCSYKLWFPQRVSIALIYTSIKLTAGTLNIKIKNLICACSIVWRVFIYASNELLCGTLWINLGKNSIFTCYCKQIKISLQESNKITKYVLII